jgi:hypothetical protein
MTKLVTLLTRLVPIIWFVQHLDPVICGREAQVDDDDDDDDDEAQTIAGVMTLWLPQSCSMDAHIFPTAAGQ